MALPLALCLAVVAALQAPAQPGRKDPAELKAGLTRDFAKGADLSGLDFTGQAAPLVELLEQAKYVQAGREPGDEQETYVAFVRSVARRLGARSDRAVELYGERVRPARAVAAAQRELDARAALAEDVRRNPGISAAKKARLARDLALTSEHLKMGLNGDANFVGGPAEAPAQIIASRAPAASPEAIYYDSKGERNWSRLPPQVQPVRLVTYPTPAPAAPAAPLGFAAGVAQSWASLTSYFDWERGKAVAAEAFTGTLKYVSSMGKMCYQFVKQALIDADIIDVPNPQSTGLIGLRPGAAAMFSQDVKKNPKILDKMGYRQVDLARASDDPASVPDGSMLIYAAGCSFAHAEHGHAELTVGEETYKALRAKNRRLRPLEVDAKELRVCHFSCTTRSMPFLRTYGKKGCLKMYVPVKNS